MDVVIETDLGADTDDFFAICYLASVPDVNIKGIVVTPGDSDQIAVAKFLVNELKLNAPVGSAYPTRRDRHSSNKFHMDLLSKYGASTKEEPDDIGKSILEFVFRKNPDTELFAIGPLKNVGQYLASNGRINYVTMQGGFIGYDVHGRDVERLTKFEGKKSVPTYNLNGDTVSAKHLLGIPHCRRRFIGKNVCHTIYYDKLVHEDFLKYPAKNRGMSLMREGMTEYLKKTGGKLFHDPTAAVCMVHPEIGTWVSGRLYRDGNAWGTKIVENGDLVLIDINRQNLWNHLIKGT
jgi:inosine-uridine nucleoside N-ribohydrolase